MTYDNDNAPSGATAYHLTRNKAASIMIVGRLHKTMPGINPEPLAWRQLSDNALSTLTSFYLNND